MKIPNEDLRLTILGCFRYSLGRMTYMTQHTEMVIKNCREVLHEYDWQQIIKEINECDRLGADCDRRTWASLKEFCEEQLKKENPKQK